MLPAAFQPLLPLSPPSRTMEPLPRQGEKELSTATDQKRCPQRLAPGTQLRKTIGRPGEKTGCRGKRAGQLHPTGSVINRGAGCSDTNGPRLETASTRALIAP